MIQQRSVVHQTYYCHQTKRVRQRPVRQFAKRHFDTKTNTFRVPPKRSLWGKMLDGLFRRRA